MPRLVRDEKGQSMVEFALILPVLLMVLGGVAYVGFLTLHQQQLAIAARAAARDVAIAHIRDGLKTGRMQAAQRAQFETSMRASNVDMHKVTVRGINWSFLRGEAGGKGQMSEVNPHTAVLYASKTVSFADDAGGGRGSASMGVGVVFYGVTADRDLKDIAGLGKLANLMTPRVGESSVMPAELGLRGNGVKGVLDMNTWIKEIVEARE